MGTKNNPGKFDCYFKAEPDEPMFTLLARDPLAHVLVDLWAALREQEGTNATRSLEQIIESRHCAYAMRKWRGAKMQQTVTTGDTKAVSVHATTNVNFIVKRIYNGGYVPDLGIVMGPDTYADFIGSLVYRHVDGEWVVLVPSKLLKKIMKEIEYGN